MENSAQAPQRQAAIENQGELQNLLFNHQAMEQLYTLAQNMADARVTVPKHLQGSVSDCMAICLQAAQWRMNPFAVAQKTHLVNGTLGYEAQLVNAVIQASGVISGTFRYEFHGEKDQLQCRVGAIIAGDSEITWNEWLPIWQVATKNSPLWKTNPKQQLGYLQVKNWARAYAPGAILGVYTTDELQQHASNERDITPQPVAVEESTALPPYPDEKFNQNFQQWQSAVLSGRQTAPNIIALVESKGFTLSSDQKQSILSIEQGDAA